MSLKLLITGGAGFIGTNVAEKFLPLSDKIFILDNFQRSTSRLNATFLKKLSNKIQIVEGSVLDAELVKQLVSQVDVVIHLAAQVAVTTSLLDPEADFDTNVRGSFTVLEAIRKYNPAATILYSSTNKVYGDLANLVFDPMVGIDETAPIDLYSPYGCSKGAADLYFLDYARSFGIKSVVFRQSCIYGPHQFGLEDQGWLAFFVLQYLRRKPITIYGNGLQVRDMLAVEDLTDLYVRAVEQISNVKGEVFNTGGGTKNSTNILDALAKIEKLVGHKTEINFAEKRLGDQDYFVANTQKAKKYLDWQPTTNYEVGLKNLVAWCQTVETKA
jgi:CDP-paratose 2-epimerase